MDAITTLLTSLLPFIRKHFGKVILYAACLSGFLIVMPRQTLDSLQISHIVSENGEAVGMVFLTSLLFLVLQMAFYSFDRVRQYLHRQRVMRELPENERKVLRQYITQNTQVCVFTTFDGVVSSLIDKGILYKASSKENAGGEQDYILHTWAYRLLKKNRDITR